MWRCNRTPCHIDLTRGISHVTDSATDYGTRGKLPPKTATTTPRDSTSTIRKLKPKYDQGHLYSNAHCTREPLWRRLLIKLVPKQEEISKIENNKWALQYGLKRSFMDNGAAETSFWDYEIRLCPTAKNDIRILLFGKLFFYLYLLSI